MQLRTLIEMCEAILEHEGDLEVVVYSTEDIHTPYFKVEPTALDGPDQLVIR